MRQTPGSCAVMLTLHSRRRLRRSAPHLLAGVTGFLVGVRMVPPAAGRLSGAAVALGLVVVEAGGGTRIVRTFCICSSVAAISSTAVRELMPYCGSTVVALNYCINGTTLWVIPIASSCVYIMCHELAGYRNGETISGCTRERGAIDAGGD